MTETRRLLDLPIRDGNFTTFDCDGYDQIAFRPSYQGWKHAAAPAARRLNPNF